MKVFRKIEFTWWYCIIMGIANIIDGLTMILTVGWLTTNLSLKVALYGASKRIYRKTK